MTLAPVLFSLAAVASTLAGGWVLLRDRGWAQKHLWRFLAFGSGVLLGMTFLHLLPEAWALDARWAGGSLLAAFALFFLVEEFTVVHACSEILEDCHVHSLGLGAFVALFLHSLTDGLAMAFSFVSSPTLGFAVSAAVLVHKFADGITLSSLFLERGNSQRRTWALTGALSLATPLGVLVGVFAGGWIEGRWLAVLLGQAAGGFLYVSTADILPRLHRRRDPLCWVVLLLGILTGGFLLPH
jgi:zinc transporter ZupT